MAEKLVDGDFLGKLLANSYEAALGAVEEAVSEQASLFGQDKESVRLVGTYSDHVIVVNTEGEFYRCEWSMNEGDVTFKNVQRINVPVVEGTIRQSAIREKYDRAVSELLECNKEGAESILKDLVGLAMNGVPMTAEAVEDSFKQNSEEIKESDWLKMVEDREGSITKFLGADLPRADSYPKAQFGNLIGDSVEESLAETKREQVIKSLMDLKSFLDRLATKTVDARKVNENYRVVSSVDGSESDADAVTDFIQFASGFTEDLDGMIRIVDDAMAVVEDGCAKCLARLHDGIAGQMREWAMAAAFAEKLARQFEPKAT